MAELPLGTVFAGHRIDGVAGRGGMGVVYRATHLALDHVVALKVITPSLADDQRFRERFVRESRLAVSIRHPNVVQVRHAGEEDGTLFVTMDYVEGSDLRALIAAERRLEPARAARILGQVAAALDAAHERGLVHRDVKPGNVLIEDREGREHVYLTDFGLTKRISGSTELTASGSFIGTLEYMAPEQIRGGDLDARADVYALGGVAFTAMAGEPPFAAAEGDVAKIYAHLNDAVPPLSERVPGLPGALDAVIARAMAKEPDGRYDSAGELATALERAAGARATRESPPETPPPARDATVTEPLPERPPRDRRRLLGAFAGLVAVALALGAFLLLGDDGDDPPADRDGDTRGTGAARVRGAPIGVGGFTLGVATKDGSDTVLVTDRAAGQLAVLNRQRDIGEPIGVEAEPEGVFMGDPIVWVVNSGSDTVSRFNLDEGLALWPEAAVVQVGATPQDVTVANQAAWVTNSADDTVTRIQPRTGLTASEPIRVGERPYGVDIGANPNYVWVVNRGGDSVTVINRVDRDDLHASVVLGEVPVGARPKAVVVDGGSAWVTNTDDDTVTRINEEVAGLLERGMDLPEEAVTTVGPGGFSQPRDIAAGFDSIWVANGGDGSVTRIDPGSGPGDEGAERIEVGGSPEGIAAGTRFVWVALGDTGEVVRIDPGE